MYYRFTLAHQKDVHDNWPNFDYGKNLSNSQP